MQKRINIQQTDPEAYKAMYPLERYLSASSLQTTHKNLIKIRASQINGCAFCINLHTKEAREAGETEQRIYLLNAWKEVEIFSDAEKALLALTEAVSLIKDHVTDEVYTTAASFFDEKYLAQIIMAIVTINAWNRIAITTHLQPQI
ncbi:carboxymuconolactone decarboxylase family protein [Pinibacter soli]|uniref:Carboxymuconolactone decarboxylase family protein n=1 Tax=Pinibacter soli TaxID=3044211 RepID=A0ABT6RG84_9BACT|nr:carboxymuconolactone decarboxylase family protein [Pinibacter soli]MDI3320879.1 carboxymuconolactone decarboxylase family protein [Pinibacter soli]